MELHTCTSQLCECERPAAICVQRLEASSHRSKGCLSPFFERGQQFGTWLVVLLHAYHSSQVDIQCPPRACNVSFELHPGFWVRVCVDPLYRPPLVQPIKVGQGDKTN